MTTLTGSEISIYVALEFAEKVSARRCRDHGGSGLT
jgi:hypothetical protein